MTIEYLDLTSPDAIRVNDVIFTNFLNNTPGTTAFIDVNNLAQIIEFTITYYFTQALASDLINQDDKDFLSTVWNNKKSEQWMRDNDKLPPDPWG